MTDSQNPTTAEAPLIRRCLPAEGRMGVRLAAAVVGLTVLGMLVGALVTSTNSGMAFKTWPDADGRIWWPLNPSLAGVLEHSHRLMMATVGLIVLCLTWHSLSSDPRRSMKRASIALLVLVSAQGLLGGYRVLLDDHFPILYPILHGTMAHVFLAYAGCVAFLASPACVSRSIEEPALIHGLRRRALIALVAVFLQIFVGVVARHSSSTTEALWTHVFFSLAATIAALLVFIYNGSHFSGVPGFTRLNRVGMLTLGCQVLLGFITLLIRTLKKDAGTHLMGTATTVSLHVVLGAWLLTVLAILLFRSHCNLRPRVAS